MKFLVSSPQKSQKVKQPPHSPAPGTLPIGDTTLDPISPELVPIVTLLSAQTHRRYHEGAFMLYSDLNGDGNPAEREWREVYGILTGNQLAYWDAASLARFKDSPEQLFQTSSKPNYLNFTDAVFNAMKVLPAAKLQLENVLVVLTTLKNRYILQFRSFSQLQDWTVALRLANFENQALQEAYTGALLSARGLRLSDIRTVLSPQRFNHEDWVKIRYGSGMAWKRCYAVIEPSQTKRKLFMPGRVLLFESENTKKKSLVGVITAATLVSAVYPQLSFFIDKSTIMKLEGSVNFKPRSLKPNKKDDANSEETSLFLMPEQHSSVPGFDTLIRFLIPLYDAFGLYGRPQRLKADRVDSASLVFGLPTLPYVHYLTLEDLSGIRSAPQFLTFDAAAWKRNIKAILLLKMANGYDGCGSSRGLSGAVSSLDSPRFGSPDSPRVASTSSTFQHPPAQKMNVKQVYAPLPGSREQLHANSGLSLSVVSAQESRSGSTALSESREQLPSGTLREVMPTPTKRNVNNLGVITSHDPRESIQLADIYHKYSTIETPSDQFNDRSLVLNGSAEEIDEGVLPSLMRRTSLINGPYPTSEKHLFDSESGESDIDELDEEDDSMDDMKTSPGSSGRGTAPTGMLAVPQSFDQKNLSYSSVYSPMAQYNEFNKQFSKSVKQKNGSGLQLNNSDSIRGESESDDYEHSDGSSPPSAPLHGSYSPTKSLSQAQQLPQIQQLLLLHSAKHHNTQPLTPSLGETFDTNYGTSLAANSRPEMFVQKSKGVRNLSANLDSQGRTQSDVPRVSTSAVPQSHIQMDYANFSGAVMQNPLDNRRQMPPQGPQPQQYQHNYQRQQQSHQGQTSYDTSAREQQYNQNLHAQQKSHQQEFQQIHFQAPPKSQAHRKPPLSVNANAALPVQQKLQHQQELMQQASQYKPSKGQAPQAYYDQRNAGPYQNRSVIPRGETGQMGYGQPHGSLGKPNYGVHSQQVPPMQPQGNYSQYQPQVSPNQTRSAPQQAKAYQQRQPHPYNSRSMNTDQKPAQTQGFPMNRQPMPQVNQIGSTQTSRKGPQMLPPQTNQMVPPRPQVQPLQSALTIRSYGDEQYQYQVQPTFQAGQRPQHQYQPGMQRPSEPQIDPRQQYAQNSQGYTRQY